MSEPERERFEAWIAGPPYERDPSRHPGSDEQTAWPGQYVDLAVQLAWEAWQEAAPRWTAVADGLPAEGVPVLVWIVPDDGELPYCFIATRHGDEWTDPEGIECGEWVRAWQPLPPGPRERGRKRGWTLTGNK